MVRGDVPFWFILLKGPLGFCITVAFGERRYDDRIGIELQKASGLVDFSNNVFDMGSVQRAIALANSSQEEERFRGDFDGDFDGDFIGAFSGNFHGDFRGAFSGNIHGDYFRTRDHGEHGHFAGSLHGDFEGEIHGVFSGDFEGEFNGEFRSGSLDDDDDASRHGDAL
eukprot:TRINITY_DN2836_c0_g2_i1.p1 TRINITY_DN2836_c0_g2~~TRINITY_DN2836_c0_g2_i1.p1  ORF type:complete len:168 (+),score=30.58 TRINITY_DN2836_c0_g2_i1:139-642(+)